MNSVEKVANFGDLEGNFGDFWWNPGFWWFWWKSWGLVFGTSHQLCIYYLYIISDWSMLMRTHSHTTGGALVVYLTIMAVTSRKNAVMFVDDSSDESSAAWQSGYLSLVDWYSVCERRCSKRYLIGAGSNCSTWMAISLHWTHTMFCWVPIVQFIDYLCCILILLPPIPSLLPAPWYYRNLKSSVGAEDVLNCYEPHNENGPNAVKYDICCYYI